MKKRVHTKSCGETKFLGRKIAKDCLKTGPDRRKGRAAIFALQGDLGSGKTTFVQGFAEGLGIKEKILSPTFVILKKFKITKPESRSSKFKNLYHIDCYRLDGPAEILALGFEEIIHNPDNIVVIEWAEKIKTVIPEESKVIKFVFKNENVREIIIKKPK